MVLDYRWLYHYIKNHNISGKFYIIIDKSTCPFLYKARKRVFLWLKETQNKFLICFCFFANLLICYEHQKTTEQPIK